MVIKHYYGHNFITRICTYTIVILLHTTSKLLIIIIKFIFIFVNNQIFKDCLKSREYLLLSVVYGIS